MIHVLDPGIADSTFPILDIVSADDFTKTGHLFSFTAASWSMFPTIYKGDVLVVETPDQVRTGDVVVFPFMGALVCHRVIGMGAGETLHTQGDAVGSPDAPIRRQDILGKVSGIIRGRNCFTPACVPHPSPVSCARMQMDLSLIRVRERLLSWAMTSLAFLKRRAPVKMLAAFVLARFVRFYLGVRAPVQSVRAYCFIPIPKDIHDGIRANPLPLDCHTANDVLIQARLGHYRLGTFFSVSNTTHVRWAAAGLGLEEYFHVVLGNLMLASHFPCR